MARMPERNIEKGYENDRDTRGAGYVPGPRTEDLQQGPLRRRLAKEHVIGAAKPVDQADECGVTDGDSEDPNDRTRPRFQAHPDYQEQRSEDDPEMPGGVLEPHQMGKRARKVGEGDRLQRPGQSPEIRELDQQWHRSDARGGGHQHPDIAEREEGARSSPTRFRPASRRPRSSRGQRRAGRRRQQPPTSSKVRA